MIIEVEVFSKRSSCFGYGCVGLEIHLIVFDGAPQPFDEHVVPPTALAVHADVDRVGLQAVCEGLGGELRPLVGVEDLRGPKAPEGLLQGLDAGVGLHGGRKPPGEHRAGRPVHDGDQIAKASGHGDIGHVRTPDLIGSGDGQTPQKIGIDAMARASRTGLALGVQGLDPHDPHEPLDALAVYKHAIAHQPVPKAPGAQKRVLDVEGIEPPHERQIVVGDRGLALVIHA